MLAAMLGAAMRLADRGRHAWWQVSGRRPEGVHGVVLTPAGAVVLVRLRYAKGWHLPGGGRRTRETPEAGLLRELREEIGLHAWGSARLLDRQERGALFLVRDAAYRPRWSLEIAEVRAFPPDHLPPDLTPWTCAVLAWAGPATP